VCPFWATSGRLSGGPAIIAADKVAGRSAIPHRTTVLRGDVLSLFGGKGWDQQHPALLQNNSDLPKDVPAARWQADGRRTARAVDCGGRIGGAYPRGGSRMLDMRRRDFITLLGGAAPHGRSLRGRSSGPTKFLTWAFS
jgi:hypothetical protein